jgi:hypothetical protein
MGLYAIFIVVLGINTVAGLILTVKGFFKNKTTRKKVFLIVGTVLSLLFIPMFAYLIGQIPTV